MAQGAWCYRACPYGRPGNAVYCGSEDANGNCPSSCDCPPEDVLRAQGGDFGGSLPKPPTSGKFSKASGKFMRRQKGGTGQPVQWKRASGEIFGLSTQQALIAVGVGVAAYFIIKKLK